MSLVKKVLLILFLLVNFYQVLASHLRAADIVATRIGEKRYRILLTIYTDFESVRDGSGEIPAEEAVVEIAGEEVIIQRTSFENIGNLTFENKYEFEYEFPAANRGYVISYTGVFRNNGIVNIQPPSGLKSLYVETGVRVDGFTQLNTTPQLLIPPIDLATVGQVFTHNPGAFDVDGDSISFKLLTPRKSEDEIVDQYRFPNHPSLGGGTFTLDPVRGDMVWDAPTIPGEYNVAFMIEEWRNGFRIGFIVRDMQIIVEDSDNERPELIIPDDTCIASNILLTDQVIAWDPNNNSIKLSLEGGLPLLGATLTQNQIRNDSIEAVFNWKPTCSDVKREPYRATFKVEDNHPNNLTNIETMLITVIGEAPENLQAIEENASSIRLLWDKYICDNASEINIWRSECDSGLIERSSCVAGVPSEWGYELIGTVNASDTTFLDDNNGFGLPNGSKYCYLISAIFPTSRGGESYASNTSCINLSLNVPVITSVNIDSSAISGQITVNWLAPFEFDTISFPGPYSYELYRSEGLEGASFSLVTSIESNRLIDTFFVDRNIDTENNGYTYRVDLFHADDSVSSSLTASSVRLESGFTSATAFLNWQNNSFWSDLDTTYDQIWETEPADTVLVDSILSFENQYTINGLINGTEYCYYVEKEYTICHDSIQESFTSRSNITCVIPLDTTPPCPPILSIAPLECDQFNPFDLNNELSWEASPDIDCQDEIAFYTIYKRAGLEGMFDSIAQVFHPSQSFVDGPLKSQIACYNITATDEFGNTSVPSNVVCQDNCDSLNLPNIFSPNNDQSNDLFVPIPPAINVISIYFKVYNRWGKLVYESNEFADIRWDGKNTSGEKLSDGVYYYEAEVQFDRLKAEDRIETYTGWITLVQ